MMLHTPLPKPAPCRRQWRLLQVCGRPPGRPVLWWLGGGGSEAACSCSVAARRRLLLLAEPEASKASAGRFICLLVMPATFHVQVGPSSRHPRLTPGPLGPSVRTTELRPSAAPLPALQAACLPLASPRWLPPTAVPSPSSGSTWARVGGCQHRCWTHVVVWRRTACIWRGMSRASPGCLVHL